MATLLEAKKLNCSRCPVKADKGVLISVRNDEDRWSLMLCPKKVKEKLLDLGYTPEKVGVAYKRFVENFARFPVCEKE